MYIVYSKPGCMFCDKAKALLRSRNIEYEEVDLTEASEKLAELKALGCRSVPQIFLFHENDPFVSTQHIGGYVELAEFLKESA